MCLIVDANVIARVLNGLVAGATTDVDAAVVSDALRTNSITIVIGGKLAREYARLGKEFQGILLRLHQQGALERRPSDEVDALTASISVDADLQSDDPHVIALAQESAVRLLFSHDKDLHKDFSNPKFLSDPRGKVYQKRSHKRLIKESCVDHP